MNSWNTYASMANNTQHHSWKKIRQHWLRLSSDTCQLPHSYSASSSLHPVYSFSITMTGVHTFHGWPGLDAGYKQPVRVDESNRAQGLRQHESHHLPRRLHLLLHGVHSRRDLETTQRHGMEWSECWLHRLWLPHILSQHPRLFLQLHLWTIQHCWCGYHHLSSGLLQDAQNWRQSYKYHKNLVNYFLSLWSWKKLFS